MGRVKTQMTAADARAALRRRPVPPLITTSLVTEPLGLPQKRALLALQALNQPSTCAEIRRQVIAQYGSCSPTLSNALSTLVFRGLIWRQRVGQLELYSRTPLAW